MNEDIEDLGTDPVDRLLQEKKPSSGGKGIAILALLVAMAAVGASGWQWWQTRISDPADTTQQETIARLQDSQQQLARSVASFEAQLDAAESPVDADELSSRNERLKAVENQLGSIMGQSGEDKASISSVQGIFIESTSLRIWRPNTADNKQTLGLPPNCSGRPS